MMQTLAALALTQSEPAKVEKTPTEQAITELSVSGNKTGTFI